MAWQLSSVRQAFWAAAPLTLSLASPGLSVTQSLEQPPVENPHRPTAAQSASHQICAGDGSYEPHPAASMTHSPKRQTVRGITRRPRYHRRRQAAIVLGIGGDNTHTGEGTFFEGRMTAGVAPDAADDAVQANIVAAGYGR
jgi:hypothetical protein